MFRSRAAAGVFATAAIVVVSLLGASPASAAPLPPGATIDVIAEDGGVYSVNSTTAVGSVVGTPSGNAGFTAIDVNQSGQGYAIAQEGSGSYLYTVNAVTGTFGAAVAILNGEHEMPGCQGIDLSKDGTVMVSCTFEDEGSVISLIGSVNPLNGNFTGFTDYVTPNDDIIRSLASNSAGTLYYFTEFGAVFILEKTGESTPAGTVAGRILGADFDISDQLWVTLGAEGEEPTTGNGLATVNVATGVITPIAEYSSPDLEDFSTVMITVWGGRLIANTGSNGAEYVPIAIGAALLLLAGVALAVTHHISHRRRTPAP